MYTLVISALISTTLLSQPAGFDRGQMPSFQSDIAYDQEPGRFGARCVAVTRAMSARGNDNAMFARRIQDAQTWWEARLEADLPDADTRTALIEEETANLPETGEGMAGMRPMMGIMGPCRQQREQLM